MRHVIHSILCLVVVASAGAQEAPSPEKFLGFPVGAEKKLARWDKIVEYMQVADRLSDRVQMVELGKSTNGSPFIMMVISSPENLKRLDHYRSINRRLFDPRTISSDEEGAKLVREAKIFVLITCGVHATEIGASQMSLEVVHRLATEDSGYVRNILDNVVFLLVPSLNPDGQIIVTDWYNKTLGTPHEGAPLPWLYHPYIGHDNNRDAYMFTQRETRLIGKVAFQDWLPAVWLDEHQMGSSGPRIFVMPAMDPINPNVDPLIYRNAGLLGFAQGAALERAGKEGIIYGAMYTYWWQGAMAWAGWWHNMVGMLTEVASARVATTIEQQMADPNRPQPPPAAGEAPRGFQFQDGRPLPPPIDVQFRSQYPRPWLGGKWSLRDIVDYELIATFALLDASANLRVHLLESLVTAGKRQIERGKRGDPFGIIIPQDQWDRPTAVRMLDLLAYAGVEVHQAQDKFSADGKEYPEGSYVILLGQPFRSYVKDMLEAQTYPKISPAPGVPPRPPYDVAGWSLGMQMGVETVFIKKPFEAKLRRLGGIELPPGEVTGKGPHYLIGHETNNSLLATNRLLKAGHEVLWLYEPIKVANRSFSEGAILVRGGKDLASAIGSLSRSLGIDALAISEKPEVKSIRIRSPRTALYQPWGGNMDEGWTRWLLEQFEFPFFTIHPEEVRKGELESRCDAIIFPDMGLESILNGVQARAMPEEFKGGIDDSGVKALREFMEAGGSLITLGQSCNLPMDKFAAPFRDALRGVRREDFLCPGSILRVMVDPSHPIAFGMKDEADAYFSNSMALESIPSFATMQSSVIVRFLSREILRSGWLQGESHLQNRIAAAEVKIGKGRMILLPLRVQHRAQSHGTFKLLFNSILTSRAENGGLSRMSPN